MTIFWVNGNLMLVIRDFPNKFLSSTMKTPIKTITLLASAALLPLSSLSAVETDPVGYVSTNLSAGAHLLSAPLLSDVSFAGTVSGVDGATLTLSGTPTLDGSSFLHVVDKSSAAHGEIVTILSTNASEVVLENTIVGLTVNNTVEIRRHFTNGDVIEIAGGGIPDNSTLRLFNADGLATTYQAIENDWYPSGSFVPENNAIIFPGEGFVLSLQSGVTLTFTGAVTTEPIKVPLVSGIVNIFGSLNPSDGDETENTTIGDVLSSLENNSTLRIFSADGLLTPLQTYQLIDGDWYASGSFVPTEVKVPAPSTVVVSSQTTSSVILAPAYSN